MIKRELVLFLIVGSLNVLIDFVTYRGLVWNAAVSVDIAKGSSFAVSTVIAYFANRFWTFGHTAHESGSCWRFGLLYLISLGTNVIVNAIVLKLLADARAAVELAFLAATGISASLNFFGMKWFVFRDSVFAESR
jgi:putative flippase GtrA